MRARNRSASPRLKDAAAEADHRIVRDARTVVPTVNEPSALRRLKHNQRVEIHIDSDDHVVACPVAAVHGSVATLRRITDLPAEVLDKFTPGALGYLLFEHHGAKTALKGIATAGQDEQASLAFVVIDGVQLPERRAAERVRLGALARISADGDSGEGDGGEGDGGEGNSGEGDSGERVEATAANVSIGGVLIERPAGLGDGPDFRLELSLDQDPEPIRCRATVVRATPTHVALRFVDIADTDRIRLAGLIQERTLSAA
jgi:PilZ domain